ncbi:hypothetical protein JZ751_011068 [Albula glossodonta]|uniref:Uncharacterized protein n=1 Tax=Albula glossodonta TaxID=121402 RepID=A0A8T2P491_9TELE|nr:hypothetical protein JZ751_011068 [Albula glossodonta]
MEKFNKLTAPASEKLRQLQKMVEGIKKNDGSIMNRLKSSDCSGQLGHQSAACRLQLHQCAGYTFLQLTAVVDCSEGCGPFAM